jgi:hypothetical protein
MAVEEGRGERSGPGTETGIHVGAGSMSEIKTALLTVRPPIRLKRELVGTSSSHRLDSIPSRAPQFIACIPDFSFLSLNRSSRLNLRRQCEVKSLQKHRCQSKCRVVAVLFGCSTYVGAKLGLTAVLLQAFHLAHSSPHSGPRSYYPPAHQY